MSDRIEPLHRQSDTGRSKHDADCMRRKIDFPYLCTCALTEGLRCEDKFPDGWNCPICGRWEDGTGPCAHTGPPREAGSL